MDEEVEALRREAAGDPEATSRLISLLSRARPGAVAPVVEAVERAVPGDGMALSRFDTKRLLYFAALRGAPHDLAVGSGPPSDACPGVRWTWCRASTDGLRRTLTDRRYRDEPKPAEPEPAAPTDPASAFVFVGCSGDLVRMRFEAPARPDQTPRSLPWFDLAWNWGLVHEHAMRQAGAYEVFASVTGVAACFCGWGKMDSDRRWQVERMEQMAEAVGRFVDDESAGPAFLRRDVVAWLDAPGGRAP